MKKIIILSLVLLSSLSAFAGTELGGKIISKDNHDYNYSIAVNCSSVDLKNQCLSAVLIKDGVNTKIESSLIKVQQNPNKKIERLKNDKMKHLDK